LIGLLALVLPVATAGLVAASARFGHLVPTLLLGYLVLVVATVGTALALSPFRLVTPVGLAAFEATLLVAAGVLWQRRGRPGFPLRPAAAVVRELLGRPETAVFLLFVLVLLAYELLLGLTVPPNNWDSLTYHLARAAAWAQHGGYFWIPNAPTDRINEFQPLAEQELLFLFAATRSGALFAVPQYLAELAILVAVYGSARRLGFTVRASACATFLLATFGLVALEASTAQNDLVAASFPAVSACLLLGAGALEAVLAGVAVGLGLGAKLTTALVLPVLLCLAVLRGRRAFVLAAGGTLGSLLLVGMWGFVLNTVHTGHVLGHGGGRIGNTTSPSWPGSAVTAMDVVYSSMDLSTLSDRLIYSLLAAGLLAGSAVAVLAARRRRRAAMLDGAAVALPLVAAALAVLIGKVLASLAVRWGHPIRGPGGPIGGLTRQVNENFSAFGPVGAVLLLCVPLLGLVQFVRRRADARVLVLASAVPVFVTLLVLQAKWNEFITRFLLVPLVLSAPVLALLFRGRAAVAAYAAVGSAVAALTVTHVQGRPVDLAPWRFSEVRALQVAQDPAVARALAELEREAPPRACLGAVLGGDEPSYLLFGHGLQHRVRYFTVVDPVHQALVDGVFYVVISTGRNHWVAGQFRDAGWKLRGLGGYWILAAEPHATTGVC
jgi:hypothetical protein